MSVAVQVLILVLMIMLNGFFALAELAVISSRKVRLQRLAEAGSRRARQALALAESPGMFLASVQVGITLVGILAGAFGEATLALRLDAALEHVPWLAPFSGPLSFLLIVLGITYLTLIIGELAPKRIALNNPERWALLVAGPMRLVALVSSPLVHFLNVSSGAVLRLFGHSARPKPPVTDEEISMLFEEGISAGVFERAEKEIVDRLLRLGDRRVSQVMTPRMDVIWLEVDASPAEILRTISESPFNAYPVCRKDIDDVVGIVLSRDIVRLSATGTPATLAGLIHEPLFLHEGFRALPALERLKKSDTHLAVIIDDYGATEGILTLTDLAESLIGEIPSREEPEVVRRPDGSWLLDGMLPIDELKALLDIPALPHEEEGGFQTLAGFILSRLGHIPRAGENFTWNGYRAEVVDMDANRIDRVLVTPLPPPADRPSSSR